MLWVLKIGFTDTLCVVTARWITSGPLVACGSWWQMDSCRGGWGDSCATFLEGELCGCCFFESRPPEQWKKKPGWLGYIVDSNYIGIIVSHYKDPYKPTSTMESNKVFFRGSPSDLVFFAAHVLNPKHLSGDHQTLRMDLICITWIFGKTWDFWSGFYQDFVSNPIETTIVLTKCFVLNPIKNTI